ncbi:hypothetical protein LOTGIDRAFT_184350 [Lottia gigantea]|uniref:Kinase n=1 Tax=Lottia gigantea TaxID=225164 RepID=V3ZTK7_LOTGI|nr:hypothetical protein LOTGIDRAFT_184350 [Lottia gigantea]ESO84251.1 hypothetical protein LOTGIDRAFT_184350 [Lottia gigantea]
MDRINSEPLRTQVAGRHGDKTNEVLDIGDGYILKPAQSRERGTREINFYQTVFNIENETEDLLTLRSFIPVFYDSLIKDDVTYMKLENITWKMKQACVMDIKIGAITWDPDAPADKIERERKKFPPSQEIGFRLAGFMIFNEETNSTEHYAQSYCLHFTKESLLHQGFGKFFHPVTAKQDVIKITLSKLYSIEKWFLNQKRFQFISSSILLVYDNHIDSETESSRKCDVRMIDFTHVHPTDSTDTNYVHGLQMLIKYLTQLVQL